ncbi:MAG: hypothetical protein HOH33_14690 [Verrucomicrobia bacterium]|jgi:hypothetical protein|nr:hypothetical protein [Verrucomicrobiota bacterium]
MTIKKFPFTISLTIACAWYGLTARAEFNHPGIAHSTESIQFVRKKIEMQEQPWLDAWAKLKDSQYASLEWQPEPHQKVERGPYNNPNIGSSEFSSDAKAAYTHALCWALTNENNHAAKAAEIVDAWSEKLNSIGNHDARLLVGMSGFHFCIAAEFLKHTWDQWPKANQRKFESTLREIYYPLIKGFYPSANGNWDASMLQTMMAMGVFLDDKIMFDRAKDYFLSGKGNGAIGNYFKESGQCQETGRDQGHTQMGLDFLANTCETAWIQGIDLYGALDNRLLKGFEYTAKYNLGFEVLYEPYKSFEGRYHYKEISDKDRGRLRPMYERVYNHYHNRLGLDTPFTKQAALKLRTEQPNQQRRRNRRSSAYLDTLMYADQAMIQETLPPLKNGKAPDTVEALWKNFEPRKEPLETEILHEWEQEDVIMKVIRYRVGIFKGKKSMMAAIYGFPKGGALLPGLVQLHGGGQYADYRAVLTNAKRGYATISVSWAGRINAPDYKVTPKEVQLFFNEVKDHPDYKLTTDWAALDAYHAPSRDGVSSMGVKPDSYTLDAIESPRNGGFFLWTLAARRALTFLERQPEVDANRLGVYGHSMGAKITVLTAGTDQRVKAAAPSCGGISNSTDNPLYQKTMADSVYLNQITCPIIFLSPSNDFHGHLSDLPQAMELIQTREWRAVTSAHMNHQDHGNFEVDGLLWFDQHLKKAFQFPETPESSLDLKAKHSIPSFTVKPDPSAPIQEVDIYYTQQGISPSKGVEREHRINRFWHHAKAIRQGSVWSAELPLASVKDPLWVYGNVRYVLDKPVMGAGYYYRVYTTDTYNLSTLISTASPRQLENSEIQAILHPSTMIERFDKYWEKDWFTYKPGHWARRTHKIYHPLWAAPPNAKLGIEIQSDTANTIVIGIDDFATEVALKGGNQWQVVELSKSDFSNALGNSINDWTGNKELRLGDKETLRFKSNGEEQRRSVGVDWKGSQPKFRNLRWIANE